MLRSKVLEMIKMSVQRIKVGRPTYLNSDEEELVVASAYIEGAHGFPIDDNTLGVELQLVVKVVNAQKSNKEITPKASSQYTKRVYWEDALVVISLVDFRALTSFMTNFSSTPNVLTSMGNP